MTKPHISRIPETESKDHAGEHAFDEHVRQTQMHAAYPVFIVGVNRKINTGNFENIDVYSGISLSIMQLPDNLELFKEAVAEAARIGFALASKETGDRYNLIKEMQGGGRPETPPQ